MTTDYSEDGVSTWIAENLPLPQSGYWLDVGCAHPFQYSQTAFLRERGWMGIAIDANPAYAAEWKNIGNAHFFPSLISDQPEERFLIEPTNALVSRRHETGELTNAVTLSWVLRNVPKIDFLALDVEGMEYSALRTLPTDKYPPIIVSEYSSCHAGQDFRVLHHLAKLGYEVKHVTGSNIIYYRP